MAGSGLMIKKLPPPSRNGVRIGSFRDSINYAMRGVHDASIEIMPEQIPDIAGQEATVVDSYGISSLATAPHEMDAVASLSKVRDPVVHLTFLYGTSRPTRAQIIEDIVRCKHAIDLGGHQHIAILHSDKEHNWHLHVVTNRVGPDGKAATLSNDFPIMENLATRINWERGWHLIAGNHNGKLIAELAAMTRKDIEKEKENSDDKVREDRRKDRNRAAVRGADRVRKRGPQKPRTLDRSRVRSLSECRMARDGGLEPAPVLQIDVRPDRLENRRVRTLDADAQRIARELERHGGLGHAAKMAAESRGDIPYPDLAGPIIRAAFQSASTFRDFENRLADLGIEVDLTRRSGKGGEEYLGVRFRSPADDLGCSGSQVQLPRRALAAKFGEASLVASSGLSIAPVSVSVVASRQPETAGVTQRNERFSAAYRTYKANVDAQNKALRETARAHAWTQEQARRSRLFARIRRFREFRDGFIRGFYGRKKSNRLAKNLMLKASAKWAEWGRKRARQKNSQRWSEAQASLYEHVVLVEVKSYLDWLRDQPRSPDRDAEIALISRKPADIEKPAATVSPPEQVRTTEPTRAIDEEKKQKPAPTQKQPAPIPEPARAPTKKIDIVEQLFGALLDGRLDEAMEAAIRRSPADREKIAAVRNLFNRPLADGTPAQQAVERDKRKRAAAIMVDRGWTADAALDEIDQIDSDKKSRAKPSPGNSLDKGKGNGIGD